MDIMKHIFRNILAAVIVLHAISCSEKQSEYIGTDIGHYTFGYRQDSIAIAVVSGAEWNFSCDADWITLSKKGNDTLSIKVGVNDSENGREAGILLTGGTVSQVVEIEQLPKNFSGSFMDLPELFDVASSKNGAYVAGVKWDPTGTYMVPTVVETATGKVTEYPEIKDYDVVHAISDDGCIMALSRGGMNGIIFNNGEPVEVKCPENLSTPTISSMSSDGSVWIGYAFSKGAGVPLVWTNGEPEILETPELSILDKPIYAGVMARGCSSDGSVIYGSEWDGFGLIYWVDGEMYYPGYDYATVKTVNVMDPMTGEIAPQSVMCTVTTTSQNNRISNNGRYLTSVYTDYVQEEQDKAAVAYDYPVIIDIETGEMKIFKEGIQSATGMSVTNEGLVFGATPAMGVTSGTVYDFETKTSYALSDWMMQTYGVHLSDDRMVMGINDESNVIFGMRFMSTALRPVYKYWYLVL